MTQKQLIDQFCEFRGKCTTDDVVALNFAYEMLAPRWISVEDELPEYDQKVLWCWDDGLISIGRVALDEQHIEAGYITHWMPLPQPPHHFADVSQKVKKGGEE